jgi:hypothetical protein
MVSFSKLAKVIVTFVILISNNDNTPSVNGRRYLHNDDFAMARFA